MIPPKSKLLEACKNVAPFIHRTPILTSRNLNAMSGAELYFKCENFQKGGAYKMRGGTYAVQCLSEEARQKGVATHSSGNFAQAVALAAQAANTNAYIVMPTSAPKVKRAAVVGYGAAVIDCEPTLEAREAMVKEVIARTGAAFLHPSNDLDVIVGQGTAAAELIEDVEGVLDYLVVPIGGGGLIAGTSLAAHYLSPTTEVIGSEPFGADDAWHSLQAGKIIPVENPQTIADGLRTSLGNHNFPIIFQFVKEIIRVEEQEIIDALRLIWERMKIIVEPSSAVPLAAVLREPEKFKNKRVGIVVSGGNVDLGALSQVFI